MKDLIQNFGYGFLSDRIALYFLHVSVNCKRVTEAGAKR
jgi:hypothetical protein